MVRVYGPLGNIDFNGDGRTDVIARRNDGKLFLYAGRGGGWMAPGRQIGHGWNFANVMAFEGGPGGKPALVAITTSGEMRVYPTTGTGRFRSHIKVPGNFSFLKNAVAVDDWDKTGSADAISIGADGHLYFHSDFALKGSDGGEKIGHNWREIRNFAPSDVSGDRISFYAFRDDGKLFTYRYKIR